MINPSFNNKNEDSGLEQTLRPARWDDYVGQEPIKKNLKILMQAAHERNEALEHILLHGPAGLGKTSLAHLIAKEMSSQIKITSGPAIERVGDLASILTNLSDGDVLFIDEVHRLNKTIEEVLYPAMESGNLDIIIGKGPGARSIQIDLPPFTLIAATTRIALLSNPLRSRFSGGTFKLDYYSTDELIKIIKRSAEILKTEVAAGAAELIALRSRFTPRIANRLLKRARDYAQVHKISTINENAVTKTLELLGIDHKGLEETDRQILKVLINKFSGGPVGLNTLAAATSEDPATVEEVYEPFLLRLGFIERTPRGRMATPSAYKHLDIKAPQAKLI
ncbi:MAG: Holliday junction branch migration DNA helicase RuvB [Candidatus Niyogibacteria bacterium]|nr:MAG: Holliday junction branch migration DNA helicase RuvB [Candidatus Niyogibacteria bacterium]